MQSSLSHHQQASLTCASLYTNLSTLYLWNPKIRTTRLRSILLFCIGCDPNSWSRKLLMWVFRQVTKEKATGALVLRKDGIVLHFREGIHVFGRQASKCSCVLEADAQVSRQHATVKVSYSGVHGKQSGIFIRDGTVNKPKSWRWEV